MLFINNEQTRKQQITFDELEATIWEHGVEKIGEVKIAELEAPGIIGIISKRKEGDSTKIRRHRRKISQKKQKIIIKKNAMFYTIRVMEDDDSTRVLEIFQQGIDGGNATFDQQIPPWEEWDEEHADDCRYVLCDENQNVVGWCALLAVSKRLCFTGVAEVSIYVDNDNQGKGLGTQLLEKLILDSEEQYYWTLQSGIFPENKSSISLHEKLGFRVVGKREKIGKSRGIWRDIILLERRSVVAGL